MSLAPWTALTTPSRDTQLAHTAFPDRAPHTAWYFDESRQDLSNHAKDAFDSAIAVLQKELSVDECQLIWLKQQNSISDVKVAVQTALKEYESRRKGTRARSWLASCSSRILYYGSIFDVFAQHHPEYVSLAWGTMKFLFIAVLNHEELLTEISKAISKIADVLPRTELHSFLYPTARMQDSVSQVYAKILEFFVLSIQWYKKGKVMHSIASIAKPFSLSFKPIIEEITERSRRVDELASAASKAEIRDLHIKMHGLGKTLVEMTEMLTFQQQQQALHSQSLFALQQDYKSLYRKGQVEEIRKSFLLEDTPASDESLAYCRSMRTRRRLRTPTQLPRPSIAKLKSWTADASSSMLLAQGQGIRTSSLDFAADFLDKVLENGYPILWALATQDDTTFLTVQAILRSLVSQTLSLDQQPVSEGINPITAKHFKSATTIAQWLALFERCIMPLERLFLLIDLKLIESAVENNDADDEYFGVSAFLEYLEELITRRPRGLKILVLSWRFDSSTSLDAADLFEDNRIYTDMGRRVESMMRQAKFRSLYKKRNLKLDEELTSAVKLDG